MDTDNGRETHVFLPTTSDKRKGKTYVRRMVQMSKWAANSAPISDLGYAGAGRTPRLQGGGEHTDSGGSRVGAARHLPLCAAACWRVRAARQHSPPGKHTSRAHRDCPSNHPPRQSRPVSLQVKPAHFHPKQVICVRAHLSHQSLATVSAWQLSLAPEDVLSSTRL